jgi:pimeloyl-ACP methyl ester carboxylesterase
MMIASVLAMALTLNAPDKNPIEEFVASSRKALRRAGLTRKTTTDGSVYWTGGRGEKTLVLLHGANDQAGTWYLVAPALMKKYRLIVPDLAGHGESDPKTGPIHLPVVVERLQTILDKEAPGKMTLVGNSMGGWVSMLYALAHPDRVDSLVLEDASGMMWDLTGIPLFPKTRDEARAAMKLVNGPGDKSPDAVLDALINRKDAPMSRITGVFESLVDPRLSQLTLPVTLIWGRHDGLLPIAYAETLKGRIAGAKLEIIEDAAHIPHRQQPAKFVSCLMATF